MTHAFANCQKILIVARILEMCPASSDAQFVSTKLSED